MTAPTAYTTLDSDDLGANKILRAATMSALDSNPVAIAQRGTGAPWLNGIGAITTLTSGSGNWTFPTGVYRIKVTAVGGGGAGRGQVTNGGDGGDTTFSTITAGGGNGGAAGGTGGTGGTASGGDINIEGEDSTTSGKGGNSLFGFGGKVNSVSKLYGGGGGAYNTGDMGGGGGGVSIKIFTGEPGDLLAYSVGAAGASGGGGSPGAAGSAGIIIIEY